MRSTLDPIIRGDGRRAATVIAAALVLFVAALSYSSSPASGARDARSPSTEAAKKQPQVEAGVRRGQLDVVGTAKSERIALRLKPGDKSRLQVDVGANGRAEFTFKRSAFNRIIVRGAAGADALSINESFGVFANTETTSLFGDAGNDLLRGGGAAERLLGGVGNDTIDGKRGRDLIEGGTGSDRVVFSGSDAAERFTFSANGKRLRFLAASTVDVGSVERFDLQAFGGADNVVVNDLAGAGLGLLNVDLANDGAADVVELKGSPAATDILVGGGISIRGVGAAVNVLRAQAANDKLNLDPGAGSDRVVVEGGAGDDTIGVAASAVAPHIAVAGGPGGLPIDVVNAEALAVESLAGNDTLNAGLGLAALTQLTLDGGAGSDAVNGGDGNDTLRGGSENDAIDGNGGADAALMGAGDDSFVWDPGDASDTVEGEAGTDTMVFNGAATAESFEFSANGNRLSFFRTQGAIAMDTAGVERVDLRALGGVDNTVVNDLSATDVRNIEVELESAIGAASGDGAVDTTTINGTGGNDAIAIAPNGGAVDVTGLVAAVKIEHSEGTNDLLNVNGLAGNDTVSGAVGVAALIAVAIDGGDGNDTINGGDGAERLSGGGGDDVIDGNGGADTGLLGAGDDSFVWDPGDGSDVVEGQDGTDTMLFNGAAAAEQVDLSANGNRLRFFRTQGAITMDTAGVEVIVFNALGGADLVTVNNLIGTGIKGVDVDLAGTVGGVAGDGQPDRVVFNTTEDVDAITVNGDASRVNVFAQAADESLNATPIGILHAEAATDRLEINTLAGRDTVDTSDLAAGAIQLLVDGIPFASQDNRP
jgi:Ca2+-binding RTX toxin-like protein